MMMVTTGKVKTLNGNLIDMEAESICIHGDHEGSALFAKELNRDLTAAGYTIKAMDQNG
jgi:UPF0271 protein